MNTKRTSMQSEIHFFQRKPRDGKNYSLEQIFADLRERIKKDYSVKTIICPFVSSGVLRRFANIVHGCFNQGKVNHITGDVNYINLFMKKNRTILTMLDCGILLRTEGLKRWLLVNIWFKMPVARSAYVTAISKYTKKHLLEVTNCPEEKIKVIYVPISEDFKRVERPFNQQKPRILQIGGAHNKNLIGLIEAVKNIDCKLSIIGSINEQNKNLLEKYNIDYENKIGISSEQVIEEYILCDLLFFVSTFEGFGMPILEANAVGRAVITGNNSSMPEVAGNAALLCNANNYSEIEEGINKLIHDESFRNKLIENGFENVKRFNADSIANQYKEIYNQILNKN
ncbi:MAG: glycosyltransferase family 4 protein [Flavobacteriales bacterium]|nr:glycosyltransferase family 4 protein [Flavobacteriales bacterium]